MHAGRYKAVSISARRALAVAACASAAALMGSAAQASTYTVNKTTGGPYDWNAAANWTFAAGTGTNLGFPQVATDVANVNSNITTDVTLNLNTAITLGTLLLSDTSNAFSIQTGTGGSLIFNNSGAGAVMNVFLAPAAGHVINTGISLADNLTINQAMDTNNVVGAPAALTLSGTIVSSGGSQTLTLSSAGLNRYQTDRGNTLINSTMSNGSGTLSLAQKVGNSTAGITTLAGANTYSGGTTVTLGRLRAVQTSGTPFGTGTINAQGGVLALAPATVSAATDVSLNAANLDATTRFNYGGGGAGLALTVGGNNSLTFTVGNAGAAANSALARVNGGTLIITPTAVANLGQAPTTVGSERFIVNGGVPIAGGIVSPTIIAQASPASTLGDLLTYDNTHGFRSAASQYTTRSGTFAPNTGEISNITATAGTINSGNPLAVRTNGVFTGTIAAASTLTVGSGSEPAGVVLNGGTIAGSNATTSVLDFSAREAAVYAGAASTISAKMSGSGGLTKFGPSALTISNVNNDFTGGIRVNNGTLTVSGGAGALGPASNTITLLPQTGLNIASATLDGVTVPQNIILNGARTTTSSNYATDEPVITTGGSALPSGARLLSGTITSGSTVTTSSPSAGLTIAGIGWTRIAGNNTGFTGTLRVSASGVILENDNALGTGGSTLTTGVIIFQNSSLGIRGGVTIANEFASQTNSSFNNGGVYGGMHAFPNLDANGSQIATWGGNIQGVASNNYGAEANTMLRITGNITTSAGFNKIGAGTLEITSVNTFGTSNLLTGTADVRAGTLRLSNTNLAGSAVGGSLVEVKSGATVDGNGSLSNAMLLRSGGTLSPGTSVGTLTLIGTSTTNFTTLGADYQTAGNLNALAGSIVRLELSSASADQVRLSAIGKAATLAGTLTYSAFNNTFAPAPGTAFDLVVADTINYAAVATGSTIPLSADDLDELLVTYGYDTRVAPTDPIDDPGEYRYYIATNAAAVTTAGGVNFQADAIRLEVGPSTLVPEPSTLGLLALGGMGLLRRRRR